MFHVGGYAFNFCLKNKHHLIHYACVWVRVWKLSLVKGGLNWLKKWSDLLLSQLFIYESVKNIKDNLT